MNDPPNLLENPSRQVQGYSVLWPLLAIVLASSTHPLGSSCNLESKYRKYLRTLPLFCLKDTFSLLGDAMYFDGREWLTLRILKRVYPEEETLERSSLAKARQLNEEFGMWVRLLQNSFVFLAFVKLCSISGIWGSMAVASIYFFSWLVLEGALLYVLLYRGSYDDSKVPYWFFEQPSRPTEPEKGAILFPAAQILIIFSWFVVSLKMGPAGSPSWAILRFLSDPAIKVWGWTTHLTWKYLINIPHGNGVFSFLWRGIFLQGLELVVVYALMGITFCVYVMLGQLVLWTVVLLFKLGGLILRLLGMPWLRGVQASRIGCCVLLAGLIYYYVHMFNGENTFQRSWGNYLP
jgi:hypothetical protein